MIILYKLVVLEITVLLIVFNVEIRRLTLRFFLSLKKKVEEVFFFLIYLIRDRICVFWVILRLNLVNLVKVEL